jgi:ribosomal protein S18 acetylase RimI-like enzyme
MSDDNIVVPDDFDLFSILGSGKNRENDDKFEFVEKEKENIPSPDINNIKIYNYDDIPLDIYMEFMELNNIVLPGDEDFKKNDRKTAFVLYILDKKVIAGCIIQSIDDDIQIVGIVVDGKYQRKGYGRMIMQYCIKQMKEYNIKSIKLESTAESDALYKKLGFFVEGDYLKVDNDTYDKTKNINIFNDYLRHLDELNKDYGIKIYNRIDDIIIKPYLETKYSLKLSDDMVFNENFILKNLVVIFKKNTNEKMIICDKIKTKYIDGDEVLSEFHINIIIRNDEIANNFREIIKYLLKFYDTEYNFIFVPNKFDEFTPNSILTTDVFKKINIDGMYKLKRKSIKRKSIKRKSIKRKSIKRKSIKRKSLKRKSIKRKSIKRKKIFNIQ